MNILSKSNIAIMAAGCLCAASALAAERTYAYGQTAPAPSQQPPSVTVESAELYSGLQMIDLNDLDKMRGGFSFGGMEMTFGATLSTLIDNIKLETVFNITSGGAEVISQVLSNLANVNDAVAALKNAVMGNLPAEPTKSTVTGPTAGVTPATGTPSALQPSVSGTQPTVVPSSSPVSTAAPIIENPIAPVSPTSSNVAAATAGSTPTATIYSPSHEPTPVAPPPTPPMAAPSAPAVNPVTTIVATAPQPGPQATIPSQAATAPAAAPSVVLIGQDTELSISDLAPVDVNLEGVGGANGFSGIVVSNNNDFTAAVHKLTQDAAISAVISNASDLRVSQKLDIKIDIQNIKSAREASMRSALSKLGISR